MDEEELEKKFSITCKNCGRQARVKEVYIPAQRGYSESYGAYTVVSIKCGGCGEEVVIYEG